MNREQAHALLDHISGQKREEKEIFLGEISKLAIQRYATAVGDFNPLYFDREYALSLGYKDVIAHPNFLTAILGWEAGPNEHELRLDGTIKDELVPSKGYKRMGGGQSLQFINPVYPGDSISMRQVIVNTYIKEGKSGPLVFIESKKDFLNQNNDVCLKCNETLIVR